MGIIFPKVRDENKKYLKPAGREVTSSEGNQTPVGGERTNQYPHDGFPWDEWVWYI